MHIHKKYTERESFFQKIKFLFFILNILKQFMNLYEVIDCNK